MRVALVRVNTSTQEIVETQIEVEDRVFFGRHLGSPLALQGEALSRQHFAFFLVEEQLMIENMSANGTSLNGEALAVKNSAAVQSGDVVEVPGYEIRVEMGNISREGVVTVSKAPIWQSYSRIAANFFDPLEIALLLCAFACICLFTYYIVT
jgi:FHA domain